MLLTRSLSSAIREAFRADFTSGFLDPRINFSRTTNATVTNSAGVITYAPHNLLTYSEQFDNAAITKVRTTISSNSTTAPNGTITADKLVEDSTAANTHACYFTATTLATSYVFSVDVKAAERTWIVLGHSGKTAFFNLSTGALGNVDAGATATITASANGFYRCTLAATATAGSTLALIYLATANGTNSYNGDGASGVFLWGAQLEVGASPTAYNSTTVKNLLGYSELFDNAAWTKSNSFVQTNLLTYSEAFDNAAWAKTSITVSANSELAPNGYQTADTLTATAGTALIQTISTAVIGVAYTVSFWVKRKTGTGSIFLRSVEATNNTIAVTNEWQRFSVTTTATSTVLRASIVINTSGDEVYVWGAQAVQGSVAGDYRRTDAAALPVYYPNHNGVVCAEKLVDNTVNTAHSIQQASNIITNTPYTVSCYGKKGELSYLWIRVNDTTANQWAWFNLNTGVVGTVNAGITANITNVGNGYYRCSVTRTSAGTGAGSFYVGVANADNVTAYAGDGTSGIYIFGAQLSDSASLDPYVLNAAAAPTAAAYYGARFDYDPVTLAPKGLLIEEQRANLLLYSSDYSQAAWTKTDTTLTSTNNLAPDGTNSATLMTQGATGSASVSQSATVTSGATYTITKYVKYANNQWVLFNITNGGVTSGFNVWFDVQNGVVGGSANIGTGVFASASISPAYNGYYRLSVTGTIGAFTTLITKIFSCSANNVVDSVASATRYEWGNQLEAGAFATSYIPTAASQVTRAADVATIQGSNFYSWFNQNEGSAKTSAYVYKSDPATAQYPYSFTENATNNMIFTAVSANAISFNINTGGAAQVAISTSPISANTLFNICSAYKLNDSASVLNNGTVGTDAIVITPLVDRLILGNRSDFARNLNGHIKSISYYPQRLSNEVLKGLTA